MAQVVPFSVINWSPFRLTKTVVFELAGTLSIPVIGCGGISSEFDVLEFLMAGASAVELYTAAYLAGLTVFHRINEGLVEYMSRQGVGTLEQVRGVARDTARTHSFSCSVPVVDYASCNGCGRCREVCLWEALPSTMPGAIDPRLCIGCNACAYICPTGAISPAPRQDRVRRSV